MAEGFRLPRLPSEYTDAQLQRWWQSVCEKIEANENSQNDTLSQLQAATQLAGGAVVEGDAASGNARSGQASLGGLTVDSTSWVNGPSVLLTTVSAGMTKLLLTGTAPQSATSQGGPMDGEYRIQEVVGITESTVYTGSFTVRTLTNGSSIVNLPNPVNNTVFARSANPTVTYRLDMRKTAGAGTAVGVTGYIFARRYP